MDGWMDGCMHGCMDAWMHGCMDAWMDGWMDLDVESYDQLSRPYWQFSKLEALLGPQNSTAPFCKGP